MGWFPSAGSAEQRGAAAPQHLPRQPLSRAQGLVPLGPALVTVSTGGGRASLPLPATRREGWAFHIPGQTLRAHEDKKVFCAETLLRCFGNSNCTTLKISSNITPCLHFQKPIYSFEILSLISTVLKNPHVLN